MERLLKSRYRIKEKIGEGPFSITYKGCLLEGEDPLVIKIYKRSVLSSSLIKSVKRKVRVLCSLTHSGIAKVIDGDYGWQGFYFVREFVPGKSLAELLREEPKMDVQRVLSIVTGVCETLEAAHDKHIIHGALNPNNVVITKEGVPKLTDFIIIGEMKGAIKQRAEVAYSLSSFLAPEEVRGEISSFSTDIYAVGLLFYLMLAGKHPFQGNSGLETSLKILRVVPERLTDLRGDIPAYLESIIFKALEKDPLMRLRTMRGLISSLKGKMLVEEAPRRDEPSPISLDGLIEATDERSDSQKVKEEEAKPNIILIATVIILAALFGIGYAVISALMSR